MNVQKNSKEGFTIIEVVLVLAIAGLIFLMIFIAWPALQRGQRDQQRRADVGRFVSQLSNYSVNNNGKIPATDDDVQAFTKSYLKWKSDNSGEFNDPTTGVGYDVKFQTATPAADGEITYAYRYKCNGEVPASSGNARQVAIVVKLEGSGSFCQSNL
jgi:prepilin-type N-terminal cleavage/methylation domain-containing protein